MDQNLHVSARRFREALLQDPYRPAYHFTLPDGFGYPGDSNGAFFADGRYHLMYLYLNFHSSSYNWGHISSRDLLHWRHHPDALAGSETDAGAFSGGAFVDEDGTAYLSFWLFSRSDNAHPGGIALASARPPYDEWTRLPAIAVPCIGEWGVSDRIIDGETVHLACADPSNIWKKDGWYYMQAGNKPVLDHYGRASDSPRMYQGDWVDLYRSKDLLHWEYVHRLYENPCPGIDDWPDLSEDDMCPSFLPLFDKKSGGQPTGKYLQLFIAHNRGAQYYIGRLEGETFIPEQHGRFSWKDHTFFAPEALVDDRNRQIMWSWLLGSIDNDVDKYGWSGVYNFPRQIWYEDGVLRMAPVEELDQLQFHPQTFDVNAPDGKLPLALSNGLSFRIRASIDMKNASRAGFVVREDKETGERVEIYYDREKKSLVMDASRSGPLVTGGTPNSIPPSLCQEEAPFELKPGETLSLDLFVDQSVIEVYANERQAICRRAYPSNPKTATAVSAFSDGADFGTVRAWEMDAANPY